jgi:hypothetical protein
VIFQKSEQDIFSRKVTDIADVRLDGDFIVITDTDGNEVINSEVAVTEVPYVTSGEDKVIRLIDWLLCDSCEVNTCEDFYYDSITQSTAIAFGFITTPVWANIPLTYTFPEQATCDSIFEVHFQLSFTGSTGVTPNIALEFTLDGVAITDSRSYTTVNTARLSKTISSSFVIEGGVSGKQLVPRVANMLNASGSIEAIYANIIIKKIR